ncbi:Gfo/Idh/MocA family protein [Botrimarina hoheduenensis]|uniref:4-carboxy-2-hydroxymuconate-6-semialdehyde dehydrogenase n=1 Tax=Botrimarina hoheduenensis TaxID=2528000 RepID=A0A5C5VRK9_9BACT|nr:Gfo/Idh/MocA family oxidoreductase [Botrimarina hoheduenensis]TWT40807.1 4-carboxy-2-hydroxymuconate-6-semialdehyde dehydrogenase [Botrimarina hoheduenensis]
MLDRRRFISTATSAAAVATLASTRLAWGDVINTRPRVAQIGVRGQGSSHLQALGDCVVAICDVDQEIGAERAAKHKERHGKSVDVLTDYRRLVERDDIDAVSIATPNHTHVQLAIAAMEAGKHVYLEKPVSHNVWEGRQLVAAARRHNRIVQCGTQSRSSEALQAAAKWVHGGALGAIQYAIGTCYKPRKSIGKLDTPLLIPSTIDYDLWCGPAAMVDLYRAQLHYDWHWDWNTGNGDMGNQGIHQMDIARWFLGEDRLPARTISIGGRLGYSDAANTPNTQVVYHDYAAAPLIFETRGLPRSKAAQKNWGDQMDRFRGSGVGVIVQCEEGHVLIPNYGEAIAYDRNGTQIQQWKHWGKHHDNWLAAIAVGDRGLLSGEIQEGHLSSALCHVGGVSHLVGEKLPAADIADRLKSYPLLSQSVERMFGHLRANDIDIDAEEMLTLGPWITIDPETERFVNNEAAQALWSRECRKGHEVPDYGV